MKFTLDWLKEFVPVRWSVAELSERLTMAGLEVESVEGAGDKALFTLGITPNRGDCLSLLGLAREVGAIQGKPFKKKTVQPPAGEGAIRDPLQVRVLDAKACPRYMARVIRGVKIGPSPVWMRERLTRVGLRPVNNVVDCTNYVMWELGHPLHAFDLRFLRGGRILVERRRTPFQFVTLDGLERTCEADDLFICDAEGPVALAGVMGGKNSEVRSDTADIVLEAAYFNPRQIHRTAKRLKLKSDSSCRFERGVDPNGPPDALHRVVQLIVETAGGAPSQDWIDIYPKKIKPILLQLPFDEIQRHLGLEISVAAVKKILTGLGFGVGPSLKVAIPTFRPDVTNTIDLVEEVARLHGYDRIPATQPRIWANLPVRPKEACAEKITIQTMNAWGYAEACHLSFASQKKGVLFAGGPDKIVFLSNPLSEEQACMRPSLLPGLLDGVVFNLNRQQGDIRLFELKKVFTMKDGMPEERRCLAFVATGREWPLQWQIKPKPVDFFSLRGILSRLSEALRIEAIVYGLDDIPKFLIPSSAASLYYGGEKMGWAGLLDPEVLKVWAIESPVFAVEIEWERMAKASGEIPVRFKPLSKYPYIERDIALVVDLSLPIRRVEEAIWNWRNPFVQQIRLFDLFKGGNLPSDKKSVAFSIRYASADRTLTNEEVNTAHAQLISLLERELPAQLRT